MMNSLRDRYYIIDARGKISSHGNRLMGKGSELIKFYPGVEVRIYWAFTLLLLLLLLLLLVGIPCSTLDNILFVLPILVLNTKPPWLALLLLHLLLLLLPLPCRYCI